jgi:hypothetical protein
MLLSILYGQFFRNLSYIVTDSHINELKVPIEVHGFSVKDGISSKHGDVHICVKMSS